MHARPIYDQPSYYVSLLDYGLRMKKTIIVFLSLPILWFTSCKAIARGVCSFRGFLVGRQEN